jgi:hypothetical protein
VTSTAPWSILTPKASLSCPLALETCNGDDPGTDVGGGGSVGGGGRARRSTKKAAKGAAAKKPKRVFPEVTLPLAGNNRVVAEGNIIAQFLRAIIGVTYNTLISDPTKPKTSAPKVPAAAPKAAAPKAPAATPKASGTGPKASGAPKKAPAGAKPTHAELACEDPDREPQKYEGIGVIISGPFYLTSKRRGKIEDTGLFELTLATVGLSEAEPQPSKRYPVVHPLAAKLKFTSKPEEGGYAHREGTAVVKA